KTTRPGNRAASDQAESTDAVVRRFLSDGHVVNVALTHTGIGNPHKFRLGAHFVHGGAASVTHGGAQTANQLVHDVTHRALAGNTTFDTVRNQLLNTFAGVLEVTVAGALPHGTQGTHTTVSFVATTLEQFDFTRGFVSTGQQAANHHRVGASGNGLGDITGEPDATVGNQRHTALFQGSGYIGNRRNLRYANTCHNTGGADGAGADTNLHSICACVGQGDGCCGSRNIATNHLHIRVVLLDPANPVNHTLGVAVGSVYHDHVYTGFGQCGNTGFGVATGTHRSTNTQTALLVFTGQRVILGLLDILNSNQAAQLEVVVDHQHFLDAMAVQQLFHVFKAGALFDSHQLVFRRHDIPHRGIHAALKADITAGNDTYQVVAIHHRQAGDAVGHGDINQFPHGGVRVNGNRVFHHTAFVFLDLAYRSSLLFNRHVLVHDANAAFLRHGDRQLSFGYRVHGR